MPREADSPSICLRAWQFSLGSLFAVILAASLAMAAVATLGYLAFVFLLPVIVSADLCRRWAGQARFAQRRSLAVVLVLVFDVTFLIGLGVLARFSAIAGR